MTYECDAICFVISCIECLHKNENIDLLCVLARSVFLLTWCSRGDLFNIVWYRFFRFNIVVGAWWMISTVIRARRVRPSFPWRIKMQDCAKCSRSSSTAIRHRPIFLVYMIARQFACRFLWQWMMMQKARLSTNLNDENDITWIWFMLPLWMLCPSSRSHLHSPPSVPLLLSPICLALLVDWLKRHHGRAYYDRGHGKMNHDMLSIQATYTNLYMGGNQSSMKYVSTFEALIMIWITIVSCWVLTMCCQLLL